MTIETIPTLRNTRRTKACRHCGEPIVLVQLEGRTTWMAFHAIASGTLRLGATRVLVEDLPRSERHTCGDTVAPNRTPERVA